MKFWLPTVLVFVLAACDVQHGYETKAVFAQEPDIDCISKALGQLGAVEHHRQLGQGMKTINGQPILEINRWSYRDSLSLDVYKTPVGWEYHNGNVRLASPNDMEDLKQDVAVIQKANKLLENVCSAPMGNLSVDAI